MIRVCRVIGEGFDLDTGQAYDKALVLTNGISEFVIPASEDIVARVLQLYAEGAQDDSPEVAPAVATMFQDETSEEEDPLEEDYYEPETGVLSV